MYNIPKCSLIDFLSFLHHIQEDRTLWHGDFGEKCFIDLHSVVDWDPCGWNGRFHRYWLMNRDVKVTWQRQENRKELLFRTIKIMLEFAHLSNFYPQTPFLYAEGICYRSKWRQSRGRVPMWWKQKWKPDAHQLVNAHAQLDSQLFKHFSCPIPYFSWRLLSFPFWYSMQ